MDEPLSNLDAKLRVQTRSEIKNLQRQVGTTTIYVTHDQVEAMTMGDRIAVMNEGVLEQVGDAKTVYRAPANMFVAGFIGSPAMSFWTMHAERKDRMIVLTRNGSMLELPIVPKGVPALPSVVVLGVRPEHARLWQDGIGLVGPIEGRVAYVEMLGRETFIGVDAAGDARLTVHAEPDTPVHPGEHIRFGLEQGRLQLFDVETQRALGDV